MESKWLTDGGAFWFLGLGWAVSAGVWVWVGHAAGRKLGVPNDGCMLSVANLVLALIGGGAGLALVPFPGSLVAALVLASALPAIATFGFFRQNRR